MLLSRSWMHPRVTEFSNPLCHCAYSIVYRDLKVAKFPCFIWYRICSRHSKMLLNSRVNYEKVDFFLYFILYSEINLRRYKIWKPCHLDFCFLLFTVHIMFMNWQFWPYYWEDWLLCCVRYDCVSEWVCVYVQASVILLSLVRLKMLWEENILRFVHSKDSKRDFSNVFL